jgi:hypothetical protein
MSTKSFTGARKPVKQPTPEQIAAFEETGRAIAQEKRIAAKAERRKQRNAETSERGNTENRERSNEGSRKGTNTESRESVNALAQDVSNTESSKSVNTDARPPEVIVRLTIDLPEAMHTRFKAGCAMTKRRMVEEVRQFIEHRTVELERECGLTR